MNRISVHMNKNIQTESIENQVSIQRMQCITFRNEHSQSNMNICSILKNIFTLTFSVAKPVITASNGATSYEIGLGGPSVTLTCTSTSGSGDSLWKLDNNAVLDLSGYVKQ